MECMSPKRKKMKVSFVSETKKNKRANESEEPRSKRSKCDKNNLENNIQKGKRTNFITACEQVSCRTYFDYHTRLLLIYKPSCLETNICKHQDKNISNIKELPPYVEESFKIEVKMNMWHGALEVCQMCITPTQYLSADILRNIVEIILNAHEDSCSAYSVKQIIDKSQQILAQNFSTHPPCQGSKSIRKCYNSFLTSPMDIKLNTFTNRKQFEHEKGIVKYCMNRLEYEISSDSKDEPLVDKNENIPEEMLQSVQGLHWQKEKLEIFEALVRSERIERLMAVLESVIELLQFDLGIWHSRYTNNLGHCIMRSNKPLMACILWSSNVLYTGAVNNNCRQILRIFVHMVHLQYPVAYLRIITIWLNTMVQMFYACETNSNSDYPNTGKYCTAFSNEFYKIITGMPRDSILRIIERIEPTFMRHLVVLLHIKTLLKTNDNCIIKILIQFIKQSKWKLFPSSDNEIQLSKPLFHEHRHVRKLSRVLKTCLKGTSFEHNYFNNFPKPDNETIYFDSDIDINHVVHTIYVTINAYLNSYNVQSVQETWDSLNKQLLEETEMKDQNVVPENDTKCTITFTEEFIKRYRYIYQQLKDLVSVLRDFKCKGELPEAFDIFSKIGLLEL